MRARPLLVLLVLTGCGVMDPRPATPPQTLPPDAALPVTLDLPEVLAEAIQAPIYARIADGRAAYEGELNLALGDGYPARLTVSPTGAVYLASGGCSYETAATAVWSTVARVDGDAAVVSLGDGALTVELESEGVATVVLDGELRNVHCTVDGQAVTTLPLRHTLTLHVRRVAGFEVSHPVQIWPGCQQPTLVVPAGVDLDLPAIHAVDATGARFDADNAPTPAALTLRSAQGMTAVNRQWHLTAGRGEVAVVVATALPVRGVQAFEVVGPEALTTLTIHLYLNAAGTKGAVTSLIEDGQRYRVFFPEQLNTVNVRVDDAATRSGAVCGLVPSAWLEVTSRTPATCAPVTDGNSDAVGTTPVAKILQPGECRLDVAAPKTPFQWSTAFSTE